MLPNSISVEVSRSSSVSFIHTQGLKKAFVKPNIRLMNVQPTAGERLHLPLERLTPNPKLKYMEQCRKGVSPGLDMRQVI
jgi:hypothetical protein